MIALRNRSSFGPPGSTTDRSVTNGIKRSTPSSVAFSTSQSNRSPLGTAEASVSGKGGEGQQEAVPIAVSSTLTVLNFDNFRLGCMTFAVENFDNVAHTEPADAAQVPRLVGSQTQLAILRRIGGIEPNGHALFSRTGQRLNLIVSDRRGRTRRRRSEARTDSIPWHSRRAQVWMPHWGLSRDPFAEIESPYVSLPSHDEAVARLVFAVETAQRRAVFAAPAGLGKTAVLAQGSLRGAQSAPSIGFGELSA